MGDLVAAAAVLILTGLFMVWVLLLIAAVVVGVIAAAIGLGEWAHRKMDETDRLNA